MKTKHLIHTLLFVALGVTVVACSGDDDLGRANRQPLRPTLPAAENSKNVASIVFRTANDICYNWDFTYRDNRLTQAKGERYNPLATTDKNHTITSVLNYSIGKVGMTYSETGEVSISLNDQNYIAQMSENNNVYSYQYDSDGHLTAWQQTIYGQGMGEGTQIRTSATLTYQNGTLAKIVYLGSDNTTETITLTASTVENDNGLLTPIITREYGCRGFEHLYYAGLLGRPSKYLIKSLTHTFSANPSQNYTVSFEYQNSDGNLNYVTCKYSDGSSSLVLYDY